MTPEDAAALTEIIKGQRAADMALSARILALKSCVVQISENLGHTEIEGLPILDWLRRKEIYFLEQELLNLEKSDPADAARFQEILDSLRDESQA